MGNNVTEIVKIILMNSPKTTQHNMIHDDFPGNCFFILHKNNFLNKKIKTTKLIQKGGKTISIRLGIR